MILRMMGEAEISSVVPMYVGYQLGLSCDHWICPGSRLPRDSIPVAGDLDLHSFAHLGYSSLSPSHHLLVVGSPDYSSGARFAVALRDSDVVRILPHTAE